MGRKRGEATRPHTACDMPRGKSSLGLKLDETPEFLERVKARLLDEEEDEGYSEIRKYMKQPDSEKLKACIFPACKIQIGNWERVAKNDEDIMTKFYFTKKQLVWEIPQQGLKKKIEIEWDDVSAIRAICLEGDSSSLHVELKKPPKFYAAHPPPPRRYPTWIPIQDFTNEEAQRCRRHFLTFAEGALKEPYEKLIHSSGWLFLKNQRPFPSSYSPFFEVGHNNLNVLPCNPQLDYQCRHNHTDESAIPIHQPAHIVPPLGQVPLELSSDQLPYVGNISTMHQFYPAVVNYASMNQIFPDYVPTNIMPQELADNSPTTSSSHESMNDHSCRLEVQQSLPLIRAHSSLAPSMCIGRAGLDPWKQLCCHEQNLHAPFTEAAGVIQMTEGFDSSMIYNQTARDGAVSDREMSSMISGHNIIGDQSHTVADDWIFVNDTLNHSLWVPPDDFHIA